VKRFALAAIPTAAPAPTMEDGHEALVRVSPALVQVDVAGLAVNVDISRACAIALGALPAIRRLRPGILAELPTVAISQVDSLEDRTLALYYAHALCAPRPTSDVEMRAAYHEGRRLREDLLETADILARKALVEPHRVAAIRRGRGSFDLAEDLIALSLLYRQSWSAVATKCAVSQNECERADVLGRKILRMLGERMQPLADGMTMDQARQQRLRCFALFLEAYDCCRRAATFLRWKEGDADAFVPTLYPRGGRKPSRRPNAQASVGDSASEHADVLRSERADNIEGADP
jgi:hypothetical protein